jgi:hypothetical protein
MAGWIPLATIAPGHGRPARAVLRAPSIADLFTPEEWGGTLPVATGRVVVSPS